MSKLLFLLLVFASGLCSRFSSLAGQRRNPKVCQHNHTQNNSVISKELKIMLSDIAHKELDGINRNHKGNQHSQYGIENLRSRKYISCQEYFTIFSRLAPNITGIPRKNENSAAAALEQPRTMAPSMVEPEREVPGIKARSCTMPMRNAVLAEICPTLLNPGIGAHAAVLKYNKKYAVYNQAAATT